ncbi:hypothetical protein R3P38DRAFT_1190073 [Favolaschia claudopus]|uniref:F-box domain-containing protein n=1 Tax=Favolaschia claudopus TaxID=2862362 RepID=A0AAW0E269_9AGAR
MSGNFHAYASDDEFDVEFDEQLERDAWPRYYYPTTRSVRQPCPPAQSGRNHLASLRETLRTTANISIDNYERGLIALDCLDLVLRTAEEASSTSRNSEPAPQIQENPTTGSNIVQSLPVQPVVQAASHGPADSCDAEVLKKHHDKMAKRVAELKIELMILNAKLDAFRAPVTTEMLAVASRNEAIQKRVLEDIQHQRQVLQRMHSDNHKMEKEREQLKSQKEAVERMHNICAYIVTPEAYRSAPIRRIPDDVLSEIFAAVTVEKLEEPCRIGTGAGVLLTQVCSRWRRVACDHPRLWTSFILPLAGKQSSIDLLESILARCKAAPLSVIVHNNLSRSAKLRDIALAQSKIATLARNAENIVHLRFRGPGEHMTPENFPGFYGFRHSLPRLELLGFTHPWLAFEDVFADAPRLRALELSSSADLLELKTTLPTSTQIDAIRFLESTSGYHLGQVQHLTSLMSIQTQPAQPVRSPLQPPPLLRLSSWHIEFSKAYVLRVERSLMQRLGPYYSELDSDSDDPLTYSPTPIINFFSRFRTPALRALHIVRLASVQGLIDLINQSSCELTSLVLQDSVLKGEDLVELFNVTPALQNLEIISGNRTILDDSVLRTLTIQPESITPSLPRLTGLRIDGAYKFKTEYLIDMLQSRAIALTPEVSALSWVDLTLRDRDAGEDVVKFLRELSSWKFDLTSRRQ